MESFIEITGEAHYTVIPKERYAEITLSVVATEDATAIREVEKLRVTCIQHLFDTGLTEGDLTEGGGSIFRPWEQGKKRARYETSRTIRVNSIDLVPVYSALQEMEAGMDNERFSIQMHTAASDYEPDDDERTGAFAAAVRDARRQAEAIATEGEVTLGNLIRVEEVSQSGERNFNPSDFNSLFRGGMASVAPSPNLPERSATVPVRYRVRFAIE